MYKIDAIKNLLIEKDIPINVPFSIKHKGITVSGVFIIQIDDDSSIKIFKHIDDKVVCVDIEKILFNLLFETDYNVSISLSQEELYALKLLNDNSFKYLARDKDGTLWAYYNAPTKMSNSWNDLDIRNAFRLPETQFLFVNWDDNVGIKIKELLDL
jgi:hypothetical protein